MKSGIWYPYNYANVDKTKCMSEITDSFNINAYTKQQCNTGNVIINPEKVYVKVNQSRMWVDIEKFGNNQKYQNELWVI